MASNLECWNGTHGGTEEHVPPKSSDLANLTPEGLGREADVAAGDLPKTLMSNALAKVGFDPNESLRSNLTLKKGAMVGLIGYALLRASVIPATALNQQGVNPGVFLAIDIMTVPPYVEGLARATGKGPVVRRLGGLALAIPSFAAPYAYVAASGHNAPQLPEAFEVFGGILVLTALGRKCYSILQHYRSRHDRRLTN